MPPPELRVEDLHKAFDGNVVLWSEESPPDDWTSNSPGAYVDLHNVPGRVELVDLYEGEQIDTSKKSLSYRIQYGLLTRTLTDEEIESVHTEIKSALEKNLKVSFR